MDKNMQNIRIQTNAAHKPNTPPEVLAAILKDDTWTLRVGVAQNPPVHPDVLAILVKDQDGKVQPAAPSELLALLAGSV